MKTIRPLTITLILLFLTSITLTTGCASYVGGQLGDSIDEATASAEPIPLDSLSHVLHRGDYLLVQTSDQRAVRGYADIIRDFEFILLCADMSSEPAWAEQIPWSTIQSVDRLHNPHVASTIGVFTGFALDLVAIPLMLVWSWGLYVILADR